MKKLICFFVCIVLAFAQVGCLQNDTQTTEPSTITHQTTHKATTSRTTQKYREVYVYITETGSKYHEGYCGCLWNSCIEVSLQDAIADGYLPCKRCEPPS